MLSDATPTMQTVGFRSTTALIYIKAGKSTCDVAGDRTATQTFSYRSRLLHEDGYCEGFRMPAA
jgi:hypothetical protein